MADLEDFGGDGSTTGAADPASIGTLTVRDGLRLSEEPGGDRIEVYVTPEHRDRVRLRSYAVVPLADGSEEHLFCRIESLRYGHEFATDDATAVHARRAMASEGIDERDYKFIASLSPVATLAGDVRGEPETLQRRQPDRLPKPDTAVREATYEAEIKTGLKLPGEGLFVGHLAVSGERVRTAGEPPTVDYRLREASVDDPLVFRHLLVAGGTGSGKTHAAKNLLRQVVAEGRRYRLGGDRQVRPSLVIIDPQDEYAQLHEDNPAMEDGMRRRLRRESVAVDGVEGTRVFVPQVAGTTYAANGHRAEQLAFTIPFALVHRYPWLVAGAELNDRQVNALRDLLRAYRDEAGDQPTYAGFIDFLEGSPTVEALVEGGQIHEATFEAVLRRVRRRSFRRTFDQDAPPITDLVDRFVRPGGISTVPTYHLEGTQQRSIVVLAVTALLVDEKLTSDPSYDRIAETPVVFAMDEAHNYLSDADTVQGRHVIGKFTEAAKQGRKERLGLVLVTQDPGDIADAVFKQINTRIALNLADEDAIASLNLPATLTRQVPDLETGQMVVHSPDNAESVQVVGLERCLVKHAPR